MDLLPRFGYMLALLAVGVVASTLDVVSIVTLFGALQFLL